MAKQKNSRIVSSGTRVKLLFFELLIISFLAVIVLATKELVSHPSFGSDLKDYFRLCLYVGSMALFVETICLGLWALFAREVVEIGDWKVLLLKIVIVVFTIVMLIGGIGWMALEILDN